MAGQEQMPLASREPSEGQWRVIAACAEGFGVSAFDVRRPGRGPAAASRARMAAAWTMKRRWPHMSLGVLAQILCRREHTTVMYGLERAAWLRWTDEQFFAVTEAAKALAFARDPRAAAELPGEVADLLTRRRVAAQAAAQARRTARDAIDAALLSAGLADGTETAAERRALREQALAEGWGTLVDGSAALLAAIAREHPARVAA